MSNVPVSFDVTAPDEASISSSPSIQDALRALAHKPVEEHPAIFEAVHGELNSALTTLDEL